MYWSSKSRFFCLTFFHLVTWDDLDLYYGHKAQEMILTDVSDTIHADSLALFALNIEILLADVTKPEKSKILTLTWPVTSSVTSGSNFWPCTGSSRTGLSNGVWNFVNRSSSLRDLRGGGPLAPPPTPPAGRVSIQTPAGRGLMITLYLLLPTTVHVASNQHLAFLSSLSYDIRTPQTGAQGPILPRWGRRHVPTMSPLYVPMAPFHRTSGDGCRWRPVSFRRIVSSISRWTGRGGNQGDALWVRSVNQHDIVCIINSFLLINLK